MTQGGGRCAYFVGDLELLALADVGGLADGVLELRECLVVEGLQGKCQQKQPIFPLYASDMFRSFAYLSAGDSHLNLTTGSRHDLAKLLADALEEAQSVVLGKGLEEVLDGRAAGAGLLGELGDNGRLVLGAQRGSGQDGSKLVVLFDNGAEAGEGLGGGIER